MEPPTECKDPTNERRARSIARMVAALDMSLEIGGVEVDPAEIAVGVALDFVHEVPGSGIAALASRRDAPGLYLGSELDDGDETVAVGAVVTAGAGILPGTERRERAPP